MINIEICDTNPAHKQTITNLLQLYFYDTSIEDACDVEEGGIFSYSEEYLSCYWSEPDWGAHLIRVNGQIAGFAFISPSDVVDGAQELADLFILKRYRRMGVASKVALHFLAERSRAWTVVIFDAAHDAENYWNKLFMLPQLAVSRQLPHSEEDATVYVLEPNKE
ncbi:MAG: hypothetical protein B0W54_09820 [Cellvibrio sp. 79]|nr:MAG: hypothetical protein B0W54_09820 [Cellvibrio sp. 79]